MQEIIYFITIAILSIFVIVKSAGYVIDAIIRYARKTGISDYLVGFLIVSFGTTLPDIVTAVTASFIARNNGSFAGNIILGDVIGSGILDMTIVLGFMAIIGKKIKGDSKLNFKTILRLFALILIPFVLGIDGVFSRLDGIILIVVFIFYVGFLFRKEEQAGKMKKDVVFKHIIVDMLVFVFGLIALLLSARYLIYSLINISEIFNIPVFIMGLFFLSAGMTLPELVVGIKSVKRRHNNIAFGDLLGAITNNMLFVLGLGAVINPIHFEINSIMFGALFMLITLIIGVSFIKRETINWKHGILLVLLYFIFVFVEVLK